MAPNRGFPSPLAAQWPLPRIPRLVCRDEVGQKLRKLRPQGLAVHDQIDQTVLFEKLRSLETFGQNLMRGFANHALAREASLQREILESADGFEGFRAFLEKRPPQWKGR